MLTDGADERLQAILREAAGERRAGSSELEIMPDQARFWFRWTRKMVSTEWCAR